MPETERGKKMTNAEAEQGKRELKKMQETW